MEDKIPKKPLHKKTVNVITNPPQPICDCGTAITPSLALNSRAGVVPTFRCSVCGMPSSRSAVVYAVLLGQEIPTEYTQYKYKVNQFNPSLWDQLVGKILQ